MSQEQVQGRLQECCEPDGRDDDADKQASTAQHEPRLIARCAGFTNQFGRVAASLRERRKLGGLDNALYESGVTGLPALRRQEPSGALLCTSSAPPQI
jgi:hypothetical protein